jgi:2-oxo-4-hydroxy-4-carboxy-5-ureidoimidazoline decarboxylase
MPDNDDRLTLDFLNALDRDDFITRLGDVYEHSPWVARAAFDRRPFASVTALHGAMQAIVAEAPQDMRLGLLQAHPDLAGRAAVAGELTADSSVEQATAGLDRLDAEEMVRFQTLNEAYRTRFGFPFIMAVRHADKARILAAYEGRLGNELSTEIGAAMAEVGKIAWMRLLAKIVPAPTGRLTTHVLCTASGRPAAGLPIDLFRIGADGARRLLGRFVTNADGRLDAPALAGSELKPGVYEWLFDAGVYFARAGQMTDAPPFLDRIPLRFTIANPEAHYHVPLLLSPWAYSTYRGS